MTQKTYWKQQHSTRCYECETWTYDKKIKDKLLALEMYCYRRILHIRWKSKKQTVKYVEKLRIEKDLLQRAIVRLDYKS